MNRELLSDVALTEAIARLKGWTTEDKFLKKHMKFENFAAALSFVNQVGVLAEAADHHPDITFGWGYADIALTTHDRGGITDFDVALGRNIDTLPLVDARVETSPGSVEVSKGFNLVTVAYYFGAMLMISACAWFLGDKWEVLGSQGVLTTSILYMAVAASVGWWLRGKRFVVGGGLLITVAVCMVPLITYSIEDILGMWPAEYPGPYREYYPLIHGSWIVMELATIAAAGVALYFVRFGFLTAPLAFSFWFFSMDLAALLLGRELTDGHERAWISVAVGMLTILIGYGLDRAFHTAHAPKTQDFAFWCYLFGLVAFWGGLTSMDSDSELNRFFYLLVNIGLVAVALYLKRRVFLIFGAIGVHVYLGHLAYRVFQDSFLFPFVLALLGLSLILITVGAQWYLHRTEKRSRTE